MTSPGLIERYPKYYKDTQDKDLFGQVFYSYIPEIYYRTMPQETYVAGFIF